MKPMTKKVVPLRPADAPALREARVESVEPGRVIIECGGQALAARVAFSCLVRPRAGDHCLCAPLENGEYCILAIITRPGGQELTLAFPAGACLTTDSGPLDLSSAGSITISSEQSLNCFADRVVHKSNEATVDCARLTASGEELKASYGSVTLISRVITTLARQAFARFMGYVRRTDEMDQVNAGQMARRAEGLYTLDSKYTVMTSKQDTKIDGERLFMG